MEKERVSIGVKKNTKDFLNYISSIIQHEVGRGDLTWDDILIYMSVRFAFSENIDFQDVFTYLKLTEEERKYLREKLNILL